MRYMQSDSRRRRIRLIKSVEQRNQSSRPLKLPRTNQSGENRENTATLLRRLFIECGGNPATKLVLQRDGQPDQTYAMDRPYRVIGSAEHCDIRLDDLEIPATLAVIPWVEGQLFYCSISQQASFFPEQNREAFNRWFDEEPLQIGPYRISVVSGPQQVEQRPSPLDRSSKIANEYPRLGFQFVGVEQSDALWSINRTLTLIGRASHCKLRLNHKSVANVQALLVRTSTGCWLVDLADDGTTAVNDDAFSILPIDVGDTLRFGDFEVEVVTSDQPPILPSAETTRRQETAPREQDVTTADTPVVSAPVPQLPVVNGASAESTNKPLQLEDLEGEPEVACKECHTEEDSGHTTPQIVETVGLNPSCDLATVGVRIQPSMAISSALAHQPIAIISSPSKPLDEEQFRVIDQSFEPAAAAQQKTADNVVELVEDEAIQLASIPHEPLVEPVDLPEPIAAELLIAKTTDSEVSLIVENDQDATAEEIVAALPPTIQIVVAADVQSFVDGQKAKLLELKEQLMQLERVYNEESKYMVSRRMRQNLAGPVVETMKCYESIMGSLEQFMQPPVQSESETEPFQTEESPEATLENDAPSYASNSDAS